MYRNTYVEINLDNIKQNVQTILKKYNHYNYYFGVVKGDAYGHGMHVINTLIENGINYLAVSNLDEAIKIRNINKHIPILCLEPIDLKWLDICSKENITITVSSLDYVKKIKNFKKNIKVHIKIDTGMNRLGFDNNSDLITALDYLHNNKIEIEGIYTHLGTLGINDPYRNIQLSNFEKITNSIDLTQFKIIHIDRSVTLMCNKKIPYCNGVRLGISLYGYNQLPTKSNNIRGKLREFKNFLRRKKYSIEKYNYDSNINLLPAFSLYSEIIEIKTLHSGEFVGYFGYIHKGKDVKIATANIGYADGLDLNTSGSFVTINNKKYKIIGTINMGMISIIIDDNVKLGDKVEIIGPNCNIRKLSTHNNTTIYKTMTSISHAVPRIYIKNKKIETKEMI